MGKMWATSVVPLNATWLMGFWRDAAWTCVCVCVFPANRVALLQHCMQDEWICAGRLGFSLGLYLGGHRRGEVRWVKAAAGLWHMVVWRVESSGKKLLELQKHLKVTHCSFYSKFRLYVQTHRWHKCLTMTNNVATWLTIFFVFLI